MDKNDTIQSIISKLHSAKGEIDRATTILGLLSVGIDNQKSSNPGLVQAKILNAMFFLKDAKSLLPLEPE